MDTSPSQLEVGWGQIVSFLVIAAIFVAFSVRATTHLLALRREGLRLVWLAVWLAVVWLLPVLGALLAFAYAGPSTRTGLWKAEPDHCTERGRATSVGNADALGRPRR